jgi:hypothetical protein
LLFSLPADMRFWGQIARNAAVWTDLTVFTSLASPEAWARTWILERFSPKLLDFGDKEALEVNDFEPLTHVARIETMRATWVRL